MPLAKNVYPGYTAAALVATTATSQNIAVSRIGGRKRSLQPTAPCEGFVILLLRR